MEQPPPSGLSGGLHYVNLLGEYWYIWRTDRTMAGTCRRLRFGLRDGTVRDVYFRFKP
jgi:hypothetical protein